MSPADALFRYRALICIPALTGTAGGEVGGIKPLLQLDGFTANRPDCESIFGIAREVAAICARQII